MARLEARVGQLETKLKTTETATDDSKTGGNGAKRSW
jgi:BMFP domain-containing protein YqiC